MSGSQLPTVFNYCTQTTHSYLTNVTIQGTMVISSKRYGNNGIKNHFDQFLLNSISNSSVFVRVVFLR